MTNGQISIKQLAAELGMDRSCLRRYVLSMEIIPARKTTPDSNGSLSLVLTKEQADLARQSRRERSSFDNATVKNAETETGVFYIIQLVPDLDPKRVKFGYTSSIKSRLLGHSTVAPTLKLVRSWPCRQTWERPAIDCLGVICRLIGGEVYDVDDLNSVVARAEQFFAMLPAARQDLQQKETV